MPAPVTATSPAATTVGRPQPQTTVETAGPFIEQSQEGAKLMYNEPNLSFGETVNTALATAPGYIARYRAQFTASGGTSTAAVVAAADAPFNVVQSVQLFDSAGTPMLSGPGWEMLYAVPLFSGQFGLLGAADVRNLPSYSPVNTAAAAGGGDFEFNTSLSLEFAMGYGLLSGANAALQPDLIWTLAGDSAVYSTPPTTLPTLGLEVDADFYWLPQGSNALPPGLGSSQQWFYAQGQPSIGSNSNVTVNFPRVGGYINTIIMILRDSQKNRIDAWPNRIRFAIDGVQLIDRSFTQCVDDMYNRFGGVERPTGVLAFTRKNTLSQISLGLADTLVKAIPTSPGTSITIDGAPWGTVANTPAQLSVIVGQILPAGQLITGLPED